MKAKVLKIPVGGHKLTPKVMTINAAYLHVVIVVKLNCCLKLSLQVQKNLPRLDEGINAPGETLYKLVPHL